MITFKCQNKECYYFPCYLRCDQAASQNEFGDGAIEKPLSCPYDMETAKWKILPYTLILQNTIDLLEEWYGNEGWDIMPEKTRDLIDGIMPFDNDYAWMCHRLPQIIGWLRDLEAEYWRRDEILEKFKKVKGLQVLRELMPAAFRAGFLYSEKIRHEGEANLTRFDEEDN